MSLRQQSCDHGYPNRRLDGYDDSQCSARIVDPGEEHEGGEVEG